MSHETAESSVGQSSRIGKMTLSLAIVALIFGALAVVVFIAVRADGHRRTQIQATLSKLGFQPELAHRTDGRTIAFHGVWRGVNLTVQERYHRRRSANGEEQTRLVLELAAEARSDLGRYRIVSSFTNAPDQRSSDGIIAGDPEIDRRFLMSHLAAAASRVDEDAKDNGSAGIFWLDDRLRSFLRGNDELEEIATDGRGIVLLLRSCDSEALSRALEVLAYMARWPVGAEGAYR